MINIHQIATGKWAENCYVISDQSSTALIIDPGDDADEIAQFVETRHLVVKAVLNTHAHHDHIGAVAALKERWSVPFFLHSKDLRLLKLANFYRQLFGGEREITVPAVDHFIDHSELPLKIAPFTVEVFITPGHTEGGVCYLVAGNLFTGDTLLDRGIGRVDLPGGNLAVLHNSLRLLAQLPAVTKVFPGHGESTTIAAQLDCNPELIKAVNTS